MKNLYQILGVNETASYEEIKRAYRKLAKIYHPDITRDDEKARKRFDEVAKAYEILGNEVQRRIYDEKRKAEKVPAGDEIKGKWNYAQRMKQAKTKSPQQMRPEDFSDIFGQYFGFQSKADQNYEAGGKAFESDVLFHSFFNPKKKS